MTNCGTLILARRDVAALLSIEECTEAIEHVFRLYGEGKTQAPGVMGVHAHEGGFHIKAGVLQLNRPYFAAKINTDFLRIQRDDPAITRLSDLRIARSRVSRKNE